MNLTDLAIYVGTAIAALALFFGLKFAASKFGPANLKLAAPAFAALDDFDADDVLIYLGSAIAWDARRSRIAIWEKATGARTVEAAEVGSWHSGTLLTIILNRTTATPMVQLFAGADDEKPFFKVGVLDSKVCPVWEDRLTTAFGAGKNREVHVRVAGVT